MKQRYNILKVSILFVFTAFVILQATAQNNWNVPADKKAKNSYIKFDAATSSQGEAIYTKNCVSCHGNPAKGNSLKSLKPVPPDLSSAGSQALTDGELSYILATGRMVMPSFKNVLSEEDRWKVIGYIRSFNKNYVQVLSKFDPNKAKLVKINLNYDKKSNEIKVTVKANEKTGQVSLKNSEIQLFAGRYFGKLQIDKAKQTDADGAATFVFPQNLPGDKTGNVQLVVNVNDDNYGEIEYVQKLKIGVPTDVPALNKDRAIWNVLVKAPIWVIFLYSFGVIIFGLFLLYILYSLNKLRKSENN